MYLFSIFIKMILVNNLLFYRAKREEYRRLQTVKGNIDQILHRERKPVKRQEQER